MSILLAHPRLSPLVRLLKKYKRDSCTGLSSDHILHSGDDCFVHIALLLSSIIVHAAVPQQFLRSSILPIPNGRHMNLTDSANYRGIAICSVFNKVFDNVLLQRYSDLLISTDLHYGFKGGHSTNLRTMVLKET